MSSSEMRKILDRLNENKKVNEVAPIATTAAKAGLKYAAGKAVDRAFKNDEVEEDSDFFGDSENVDKYDEVTMAKTQLEFIQYAAEELCEYFNSGYPMEEWVQNKLTKAHTEIQTLHSWMEGEKRKSKPTGNPTGMIGDPQ